MTQVIAPEIKELDLDQIASCKGVVVAIMTADQRMDAGARQVNRLTKGVMKRFGETQIFTDMRQGQAHLISMPTGLDADSLIILKLDKRPSEKLARKAGSNIGKLAGRAEVNVILAGHMRGAEILCGIALRRYAFTEHQTAQIDAFGGVTALSTKVDELADAYAPLHAIAEGVFFTRDLTNEPANVLTTVEFADRLIEMKSLGLKVSVLEEDEMEKLGMHSLLGVGLGSESPSKIVIMEWNGGGDEPPFALIGKGVVFDTGGISLKPAAGMEDMTMDMGGAGVVAGAMKTLALRKAKANVVGLVGLVENMPDAKAQRPGDVVKSMKGDTIEVINTDAEGRLVLADVLWYAQETYNPVGMVDLATLTGAIIIGLGHENAGVFSNDNTLCNQFLNVAGAESEGAWRMPLGDGYDKMLKSNIADMKNIGGRPAGSVTAAQFLQRFVKPDTPWIHLDIAGVASVKSETSFAPKGATGWGVAALNRLIADHYEN